MRRLVLILVLLATPLWAVEPDEMLDDPVLENRARELSQGLRCPVCQNESIDESNAPVAKELRIVLRERLLAGDSDAEAVEYIVNRFGEFVLLEPRKDGANLILWLAAPAMFLAALIIGWGAIRRRKGGVSGDVPLTDTEKEALDKILRS